MESTGTGESFVAFVASATAEGKEALVRPWQLCNQWQTCRTYLYMVLSIEDKYFVFDDKKKDGGGSRGIPRKIRRSAFTIVQLIQYSFVVRKLQLVSSSISWLIVSSLADSSCFSISEKSPFFIHWQIKHSDSYVFCFFLVTASFPLSLTMLPGLSNTLL